MTVNELATKLSVAPDTVRYYTRIGLLRPEKNPNNGYKHYRAQDEKHLKFALRAKLLGFTLRDIQQIVEHAETGASPCPLVRTLIAQRVAEVRAQVLEAQALFQRMEQVLQQWDRMPDQAPTGDSICHLVEEWEDTQQASVPLRSRRPVTANGCH